LGTANVAGKGGPKRQHGSIYSVTGGEEFEGIARQDQYGLLAGGIRKSAQRQLWGERKKGGATTTWGGWILAERRSQKGGRGSIAEKSKKGRKSGVMQLTEIFLKDSLVRFQRNRVNEAWEGWQGGERWRLVNKLLPTGGEHREGSLKGGSTGGKSGNIKDTSPGSKIEKSYPQPGSSDESDPARIEGGRSTTGILWEGEKNSTR